MSPRTALQINSTAELIERDSQAVWRRSVISWICCSLLVLFTGCESVPNGAQNAGQQSHVPPGTTNSPAGIKTSFSAFVYGPPPVAPTELSGDYCQRFWDLLRWRLYVLSYNTKLDTNDLGEIRVQFHLNADGSISDLKTLTNTVGVQFGQACESNILGGKPFGPWPKEMHQKQYAGYFTIRACYNFQLGTNDVAERDTALAATLMPPPRSNVVANVLTNFQTDPAYLTQGLIKMHTNDYSGAIADFTKAIEWDTEDAWAYSGRGFCRDRLKDYPGAMSDLSKAIELDPQNASAWGSRGLVRLNLKDYARTITDCTKAIELDSDLVSAYGSRAYARKRLQDFDGAMIDINECLHLDPTNAVALFRRSQIRYCLHDYENALIDCNQAIEINHKYAAAYASRGSIQQALSQQPAALESFRTAVGMDATLNYAWFQIWAIRSQAGEMEAANKELEAHFRSRPASQKDEWSYKVEAFLVGSLNEKSFLDAANESAGTPQERPRQICEADYYAGMKHLLAGDNKGASNLFRQCVATGVRDFIENNRAQAELTTLQGQM